MTKEITSALAMSHPTVVETIKVLAEMSQRLQDENDELKAALAPTEQEPWGACVYGRVFVGKLPAHARKFSEDEGVPIQWLYTTLPKRERAVFPTMLRKMWSGSEVQAWLDENVNKEKNT